MRAHVIALNQKRRSQTMSNADKRAAVVAELKAHPDESDNKIAQRLGVHNETVTSARRQLTESVTTPQIPAQERQSGTLAAQSPRSAEVKPARKASRKT